MPTKLEQAHSRAARVAELSGGSLLVGLSGKDSFVTLDIAAQHFKRIVCFNMYFVRGLECVEAPLRSMCALHKVELLYVPHYDLCRMLKNAVYRPHHARLDHTPEVKKGDLERLARKRSGISWIAYGERLADSFARRLFWRKLELQGIYPEGQRCTIIPDWLDEDVYAYMTAKKLPTPCRFGLGKRSSEFKLTADVLGWLQQHHPEDYRRVLRVFPGAAAELLAARA